MREEVKEQDFLLTGEADKQYSTSSHVNAKDLMVEQVA